MISPVFLFCPINRSMAMPCRRLSLASGGKLVWPMVSTERDDIEAVFVTRDKKVYVSDGLIDNFELTNDDYVWENE